MLQHRNFSLRLNKSGLMGLWGACLFPGRWSQSVLVFLGNSSQHCEICLHLSNSCYYLFISSLYTLPFMISSINLLFISEVDQHFCLDLKKKETCPIDPNYFPLALVKKGGPRACKLLIKCFLIVIFPKSTPSASRERLFVVMGELVLFLL